MKDAFPEITNLYPERKAARKALSEWAKVHRQRDRIIRQAVNAGIDQRSIQEITGIARTTIARITQRGTPT